MERAGLAPGRDAKLGLAGVFALSPFGEQLVEFGCGGVGAVGVQSPSCSPVGRLVTDVPWASKGDDCRALASPIDDADSPAPRLVEGQSLLCRDLEEQVEEQQWRLVAGKVGQAAPSRFALTRSGWRRVGGGPPDLRVG